MTLLYVTLKFQNLITRKNPDIDEVIIPEYFPGDHTLDLNEIGFKWAFTIQGAHDNERKDDPRYIKIIAKYQTAKGKFE